MMRKSLVLFATAFLTCATAGPAFSDPKQRTLIDFSLAGEQQRWTVVTDSVMGGRSSGAWTVTSDHTAVFDGRLRLGDLGGFVSARCAPHHFDLSGYEGIALRVRGDGRTYRLRLRTDERFESIAYQASFRTDPGGEWITVRLAFRDFVASHHGSILPDAGPLEPAEIRQIGLMVADPPEGMFRLTIDWIQAYRSDLRARQRPAEERICNRERSASPPECPPPCS
jgi:monofunctional biosynthetic peptidoglycan transglycosylase